jgi:hypothetical protein
MTKLCDECETVAHCLKHGCIPKQTALDKKAENARELGLDYEPVPENFIDALKFDVAMRDAAPVQEPVAWMFQHEETGRTMCVDAQQVEWGFEKGNPRLKKIEPLYTTPPVAQRQWVGLIQQERKDIWREAIGWGDPSHDDIGLMIAIEAKLKEKNT